MSTAWEQLEGAALSLARSAPIKERLADAYRNHLALVNADELPAALRAELRACHDALTRERPLRGEDAVRATVRKMSSRQADEVACSVVRLLPPWRARHGPRPRWQGPKCWMRPSATAPRSRGCCARVCPR